MEAERVNVPRRFLLLDRTDPDQPMWLAAWVRSGSQQPAVLDDGRVTEEEWKAALDMANRHFTVLQGGPDLQLERMAPAPIAWEVREVKGDRSQ